MALAIEKLVRSGLATARRLVPAAFPTTTVRLGPTSTVDPVLQTTSTAWAFEFTGPIFAFDDESNRDAFEPETLLRTFLLDPSDFPDAGADFNQDGQVVDVEGTWHVFRVSRAPGDAVVQLFARR